MTHNPGTAGITQIAVIGNYAEIMITVGNSVVTLGDPGPDGSIEVRSAPQWLSTFSMPPQVAMQLVERLGHALMEYQQRFGALPRDPNFKIEPGKTLQ